MGLRVHSVTFDCHDPHVVAHFWAAAIGYRIEQVDEYGARLTDPVGTHPRLLFLPVPESKAVKNRVHLDLHGGDMNDEVARLTSLGATVKQVFDNPGDVFTVMADPEGNEFCIEQSAAGG
jgi:predicted enzyme related to lactoylglutathione lyase